MFANQNYAALALTLISASALALPSPSQIFTAEDLEPGEAVTAGVLAARTAFLSRLDSTVQSFGFERPINAGAGPTLGTTFAGSAGAITANLVGNIGQQVVGMSEAGRFNTTAGGSQYWRVDSTSNGSFSINFSRSISAFGFYATDVGDFGGVLSLDLTRSADNVIETLLVRPQNSGSNIASGSLLFFGFADQNSEYSRVTFRSTGTLSTPDYFGFDDFVVADRGQIRVPTPPTGIPEPGSLALVGLALFAAASVGKARKTLKPA